MLSLLWTSLVALVAIPLRALVRFLRRRQLGNRGVLELRLSHDAPGRPSLDRVVSTLAVLRAMQEDELLRAVLLRIRNPGLGWAAVQELREALVELRQAGKLVVVHLEHAGNAELLLASAADRVYLAPAAELMLTGIGAQLVFYGDALSRLGIQADFESAGAYKSFGEPFSRAWATPENREAMRSLVADLDQQLVHTLATARRVPPDELRALFARSPVPAQQALDGGLVDGLAYADQVEAHLSELLDRDVDPVPFRRYARLLALERALDRAGRTDPRVVVVHLEGAVVHGTEPQAGRAMRIDADRVVPVLDGLLEDDKARAVVLYIDSPGGSALASDLIARGVRRLGERKPVVAAFGNVSASGGYYIAAPAAEVIARPGSITGSIGVVGGKISVGAAAAEVGVHTEPIVSSDSALMFSPWRAFREEERQRFRQMLDRTYRRFLDVVAAGRRRTLEEIEPVAQGRVWTGQQALDNGLVDHVGGLNLAIERARSLAGLPARPLVHHVSFPPPRFRLLSQLFGRAEQPTPDLVELGLASLGEAGARLSLLRAHPGMAMTLMPWILTPGDGQGLP